MQIKNLLTIKTSSSPTESYFVSGGQIIDGFDLAKPKENITKKWIL